MAIFICALNGVQRKANPELWINCPAAASAVLVKNCV